jgi:hypothetical protein
MKTQTKLRMVEIQCAHRAAVTATLKLMKTADRVREQEPDGPVAAILVGAYADIRLAAEMLEAIILDRREGRHGCGERDHAAGQAY